MEIIDKNFGKVNQFGQFKQLIVGAGAGVFKAQGPWVWGGSTVPSSAKFSIYLPTGALTTTGTINATGGTISGDLTVTGSLLSDDGATFQTKLTLGKLSFLKAGVEKSYIKTSSDSSSLTLASGSLMYYTTLAGVPIISFEQSGNIHIENTNGVIYWGASGNRSITASSSKLTVNGDFEISGSYRVGTSAGVTGSLNYKDHSGTNKVASVVGGIITDLDA